jgi:hypothetical protein
MGAITIPEGLKRVATTVQMRGFAYLDPHPNGCPNEPVEGPGVIVHGLSCGVPGVPNHFLTLLEVGQPISVGRMGALHAQIDLLVGNCRISCKDVTHANVVVPIETKGAGLIQFPITLEAGGRFDIAKFPESDHHILYIESLGTIAILLVTRVQGHHDGGDSLHAYAGGCTSMCSSGCPHGLLIGGMPTPALEEAADPSSLAKPPVAPDPGHDH